MLAIGVRARMRSLYGCESKLKIKWFANSQTWSRVKNVLVSIKLNAFNDTLGRSSPSFSFRKYLIIVFHYRKKTHFCFFFRLFCYCSYFSDVLLILVYRVSSVSVYIDAIYLVGQTNDIRIAIIIAI